MKHEDIIRKSNIVWTLFYPVGGETNGKCMLYSAGQHGYHDSEIPTFVGTDYEDCLRQLSEWFDKHRTFV